MNNSNSSYVTAHTRRKIQNLIFTASLCDYPRCGSNLTRFADYLISQISCLIMLK